MEQELKQWNTDRENRTNNVILYNSGGVAHDLECPLRGHSRSWAMPPFDRAHTTSYSTLINRNSVSIFYRFRDITGYLSKVADFDPPHLHLVPP